MHISSRYAKILRETNFCTREIPRSGSKAKDGEKRRKKDRTMVITMAKLRKPPGPKTVFSIRNLSSGELFFLGNLFCFRYGKFYHFIINLIWVKEIIILHSFSSSFFLWNVKVKEAWNSLRALKQLPLVAIIYLCYPQPTYMYWLLLFLAYSLQWSIVVRPSDWGCTRPPYRI